MSSRHRQAVVQALLVTFLWATSWVFIKVGLKGNLQPLTFAGLRYTLAFLCLAPVVLLKSGHRRTLRCLSLREWGTLALLGIVFYTLTQGAQFLSLDFLPAATVSLLLNLTPLLVACSGILLLREQPAGWQWGGIAISGVGVALFFLPAQLPPTQILALVIALACVLANTGSSLIGRYVNSASGLSPLLITFVSMGIGAVILLAGGIALQGIGQLTRIDWAIVTWLAIVNTALAFTLWNNSLRTLTAAESSVLNSLMLPQIAVLAFVFLGEGLTAKQIAGLALVTVGALLVQFKSREIQPGRVNGSPEPAPSGTGSPVK